MANTSVHSRWETQNLVFYSGATRLKSIPSMQVSSNPLLVTNVIHPGLEWGVDDSSHFMSLSEDEWTLIKTDAGVDGAEVHSIGDAHGGVLVLTTNDADEDETGKQRDAETILLDGNHGGTWFAARIKVDDADKCEILVGLSIRDTKFGVHHTANGGVTDGVYIRSLHNTAAMLGVVEKDSAESTVALGNLADNTWVWVGFYVDADGTTQFQVNGVDTGAAVVATNIPDDEALALAFVVQTGEAVVHTLSVDAYRLLAQL